ncbi:hypothetical protein BUE80_DR008923 [Diplocarpon rosae]|nr:hypothetical protein BUE80_DR008923 [Diplocarpon rosae]
MGATQIGPAMSGALTPLKTPLILSVAVVCLIWSLLTLDVSVTSTVTDQGPVAEDRGPEGTSIVVTVPTDTSKPGQDGKTTVLPSASATKDRPLVLYAYADSETGTALENLKFFVAHGLHAAADFIFIINGETKTDVAALLPEQDNIRTVQRENDCYDLGAYAEILKADDLYKGYKRFITMNASIRGPFVPYWSEGCWTDMFLSKVTDEVKLVGITANCWPTFHVQSMIWATDIIGIETLLFPPQQALDYLAAHPITLPPPRDDDDEEVPSFVPFTSPADPQSSPKPNPLYQAPGINGCFHTWKSAVAAEISSTSVILAAGYKVDAIMSAYHGNQEYEAGHTCDKNRDVLFDKEYFGINVHPFETVFIKANRNVDPMVLQRHSMWVKQRGYSSYDYCKA